MRQQDRSNGDGDGRRSFGSRGGNRSGGNRGGFGRGGNRSGGNRGGFGREALVPGVVETMDSIVHLVREKCIRQYALTANKNVKFRSSRLKASLFIAGIVFQDIRSFRTE